MTLRFTLRLADVDVEASDGVEHEPGQQRRLVTVEQPGQRPPHPVVVTQPFPKRVGRLATDDEVADHHPHRARRCQLQTGVVIGEKRLQQPGEPEPVEGRVDDRQRPQQPRVQLEPSWLIHAVPPAGGGCLTTPAHP